MCLGGGQAIDDRAQAGRRKQRTGQIDRRAVFVAL
jgi:hypothetical protein